MYVKLLEEDLEPSDDRPAAVSSLVPLAHHITASRYSQYMGHYGFARGT
jgi:hypothetical protein